MHHVLQYCNNWKNVGNNVGFRMLKAMYSSVENEGQNWKFLNLSKVHIVVDV